jgi:hypothetical protein
MTVPNASNTRTDRDGREGRVGDERVLPVPDCTGELRYFEEERGVLC